MVCGNTWSPVLASRQQKQVYERIWGVWGGRRNDVLTSTASVEYFSTSHRILWRYFIRSAFMLFASIALVWL